MDPVQTEFIIILRFSTPCELNECLTVSNCFFTHCSSVLDIGWQDSCPGPRVHPLGSMRAFAIDLAWQINVMWLVWLSMLSLCSGLWSWHWTQKGYHHQGIWQALITGLSSQGAGLMSCVNTKTWNIHLSQRMTFVWHRKTYHLDSGLWTLFVSQAHLLWSIVNHMHAHSFVLWKTKKQINS